MGATFNGVMTVSTFSAAPPPAQFMELAIFNHATATTITIDSFSVGASAFKDITGTPCNFTITNSCAIINSKSFYNSAAVITMTAALSVGTVRE